MITRRLIGKSYLLRPTFQGLSKVPYRQHLVMMQHTRRCFSTKPGDPTDGKPWSPVASDASEAAAIQDTKDYVSATKDEM